MKQQRVVLSLLLSLLISGGCTYLLAHKLSSGGKSQRLPDVMYAAAAHSLQSGEVLRPEGLQLIPWPADKPLHGAFSKTSDLVGRAALFPLASGQPILDRDVSASGAGTGLAARIPEGMRAIALKSDEVAGVAGFLNPGSHVDVLVTFRTGQTIEAMTATVLQNVQVIAVGQRAEPDPEGKPTPAVTVVTLLLTPEQSERAVLASTQGSVQFILRNAADAQESTGGPVQLSALSGEQPPVAPRQQVSAAPPAAPRPHVAAPRGPEIETVLGSQSPDGKREGSGQQ